MGPSRRLLIGPPRRLRIQLRFAMRAASVSLVENQ
jgi:hypothetical protein